MPISPKPRRTSLVEGVCEKLTEEIRCESESTEDRYLPAERVLAEQFGVSRGVVREATKRLEQQGMLEIQHGARIKIVDKTHRPFNESLSRLLPDAYERLRQLNEMRLAVEPEAALLAASRVSPAEVQSLRKVHEQLEAASNLESSIYADIAFHRAVAQSSHNLIFCLVLDTLAEIGFASRQRTIGRTGKQTAIDHHRKILEAIERRDAMAAKQAMYDHILAAGQDLDLNG